MSEFVVAILGTGLMGAPMARNMLATGFSLRAWNRSRSKADALIEHGGTVFDTPGEAVKEADFVVTMLTDGSAVEDLLFNQGTAGAIRPGTIVVDMSSIKPAEAREHSNRLRELSIHHLDAPVSGGTKGAEAGTLAIMVGGEEQDFAKALPVLKSMGRPVLVGPSGSGQLAKLCNQVIVAITIGCVAEAMLLMKQNGGDPGKLRDALKGGFADSIILQQQGERMTTGNFIPGGASSNQLKDLNNALEVMQQSGLKLPLAQMMRDRFERLVQELDGANLDHSAIYLELLDTNGLKNDA